jgi:hypothetical protein
MYGSDIRGCDRERIAMANRRLSSEELMKANELLSYIRARLDEASDGDKELRFALNRKVFKELSYDERGKPIVRRKLKREKWEAQDRMCAECGKPMELAYSVLDRHKAVEGYTPENTRVIHATCDYEGQASKGYK